MKVTFKKEYDLNINMHRLMNECVYRLKYQWTPNYKNIEFLVLDTLELVYDINLNGYDNINEVMTVVAKNLLLWCLENNYIKEHDQLASLG